MKKSKMLSKPYKRDYSKVSFSRVYLNYLSRSRANTTQEVAEIIAKGAVANDCTNGYFFERVMEIGWIKLDEIKIKKLYKKNAKMPRIKTHPVICERIKHFAKKTEMCITDYIIAHITEYHKNYGFNISLSSIN